MSLADCINGSSDLDLADSISAFQPITWTCAIVSANFLLSVPVLFENFALPIMY